jgi:hypothetical protein
MKLTGNDQMYFYDAIAPIVAADSIDTSIAFRAARYDKGGDDYLNCPFDQEQYARFYAELLEATSCPAYNVLRRRAGLKRVCHRGAGASRRRYASLWPDEACRTTRSAKADASLTPPCSCGRKI